MTKEKKTAETKLSCGLYDDSGKESGTAELNAEVFGAQVLPDLVHQVVRWQRAKARRGTHSVLTRSNIKGGAKKPWKQKGTGRARAGSSVSPVWVGGAVVHGPTPRSYEFRMNAEVKRKALCSALSSKVQTGDLKVVKSFPKKASKTKDLSTFFGKLGMTEKGLLLVVGKEEAEVMKSSRNIKSVSVVPVNGLNVYDILKKKQLVISEAALKAVEERVGA